MRALIFLVLFFFAATLNLAFAEGKEGFTPGEKLVLGNGIMAGSIGARMLANGEIVDFNGRKEEELTKLYQERRDVRTKLLEAHAQGKAVYAGRKVNAKGGGTYVFDRLKTREEISGNVIISNERKLSRFLVLDNGDRLIRIVYRPALIYGAYQTLKALPEVIRNEDSQIEPVLTAK